MNLFQEQTLKVEAVVNALNGAISLLNKTMPIKQAPADWDYERWIDALESLDQAVYNWNKTLDKWVYESQ